MVGKSADSQLTSSQRTLYPSLDTIPVLHQQQRELLGGRAPPTQVPFYTLIMVRVPTCIVN